MTKPVHSIEESLLDLHAGGFDRDYRRSALFDLIAPSLPTDGLCLDLGCGRGEGACSHDRNGEGAEFHGNPFSG